MHPVHFFHPTLAWLRKFLFACFCYLVLASSSLAQEPTHQTEPACSQACRDKLKGLSDTANGLVDKLQGNRMEASHFRIQVTLYRESLRDLMLADQQAAATERLPRSLLMDQVRMAALLQAAANCETGRYLVCPADLMERLQQQRRTLTGALAQTTHPE